MDIQTVIDNAKNLPPSPQILPKLLTVLQDENASSWEISKLLRMDQSLTSQILTWSNSVFYGYTDRTADIEEAVSRVGMAEIYKLVGIVMSKRLMNRPLVCYGLDAGELWENSIAGAFSMEELATLSGENATIAYTIGLLHGIGKVVLGEVCMTQYKDVFKVIEEKGVSLVAAEKEVLGFDHADVGEALLEKWNFKMEISEPIGYQYKPHLARAYQRKSYMMNAAHGLIASLGQAFGKSGMAIEMHPECLVEVGLIPDQLQMSVIAVQEKLEDVKTQLQVA